MCNSIDISDIKKLHDNRIVFWKNNDIVCSEKNWLGLVEKNHAFNYQLWHAEDKARRDDKGFEFVYHAKREIDDFNQQRNNFIEAMDEWLFNHLNPADCALCPVHSETPGMIIDRLSILSLKIYHMKWQTLRDNVDKTHILKCQNKLELLLIQQAQLLICLEQLYHEVLNKTRTFKIYRSFKMYNDPTLNPELYTA